jgi:hypothetical protein
MDDEIKQFIYELRNGSNINAGNVTVGRKPSTANEIKAADLIESLQAQLSASQRREQDAQNELCQKCGRYHEAHKGACDGCKWKEMPNA